MARIVTQQPVNRSTGSSSRQQSIDFFNQIMQQNQRRAERNRGRGLVSGSTTVSPIPGQAGQPMVNPLVEQFQLAMNSANEANERRFQEGLRLFEEQRRLAASMGAQEAQDIRASAAQTQARGQQDLVSRGLGNTTAVLAPRVAAQQEEAAGLGRLRDRQTQRRLGIIGDQIGFIERREDIGPDMSLLAQLMQSQGQASVMPQSSAPTRRRRERGSLAERNAAFFGRSGTTQTGPVRGTLPRLSAPTGPVPLTPDIIAELRAGLAANRRVLGDGRGDGTLSITGGRNPTTTFTSSRFRRFGDNLNQPFRG